MKKIFAIISIPLSILFIYKMFVPRYHFHYYYSKDKKQVLTRVTGPNAWWYINYTYFTPGYYDRNEIPDAYIKPEYDSEGDWSAHVILHDEGIYISCQAETKGTSDSFRYRTNSFAAYRDHMETKRIEASFRNREELHLYSFDKY